MLTCFGEDTGPVGKEKCFFGEEVGDFVGESGFAAPDSGEIEDVISGSACGQIDSNVAVGDGSREAVPSLS